MPTPVAAWRSKSGGSAGGGGGGGAPIYTVLFPSNYLVFHLM
jgi:hypothetical protein